MQTRKGKAVDTRKVLAALPGILQWWVGVGMEIVYFNRFTHFHVDLDSRIPPIPLCLIIGYCRFHFSLNVHWEVYGLFF